MPKIRIGQRTFVAGRRRKVEDSQEQRRTHDVRDEEDFVVVLPDPRQTHNEDDDEGQSCDKDDKIERGEREFEVGKRADAILPSLDEHSPATTPQK